MMMRGSILILDAASALGRSVIVNLLTEFHQRQQRYRIIGLTDSLEEPLCQAMSKLEGVEIIEKDWRRIDVAWLKAMNVKRIPFIWLAQPDVVFGGLEYGGLEYVLEIRAQWPQRKEVQDVLECMWRETTLRPRPQSRCIPRDEVLALAVHTYPKRLPSPRKGEAAEALLMYPEEVGIVAAKLLVREH